MRKLFPHNQCVGLTQLVAFESLKHEGSKSILLLFCFTISIDNNKKRQVMLMKIEVTHTCNYV